MMNQLARYMFLSGLIFFATNTAYAQSRWALIIANQNYQQAGAGLKGPIGNAASIKQALHEKGFRLFENKIHSDLSKRAMEQLITRYSSKVQGADAALVYYAGHGVQNNRANYLIPVNARIQDNIDVRYEGVELRYFLDKLAAARTKVNLVLLDACRDNPFGGTRTLTRGLARTSPSGNNETIISYSTSEGHTAADKSPYTPALVSLIRQQSSLEIEILLKKLGAEVRRRSNGRQRPDYTSSLTQSFCFGTCLSGNGQSGAQSIQGEQKQEQGAVSSKDYREPAMQLIRGGTFTMGSPSSEKGRDNDEKPHSVRVGDFYLGKYEITVGEFKRFVQAKNYRTTAESSGKGCYHWSGSEWKEDSSRNWKNPGFSQTDRHPVVCVSWQDAMAYANWLSGVTGKRYSLLTEAQWEYAARAGTKAARYWGEHPNQACAWENVGDQALKQKLGWSNLHECNDRVVYTAAVGQYRANGYQLHDMLGNVVEWVCSDYEEHYSGAEQRCAQLGSRAKRTLRGGSWGSLPRRVRSAFRYWSTASFRSYAVGFRLSRTP